MAKQTKPKLYACTGCGDPTHGSVSKSTGKEYDCCPLCCERVDETDFAGDPADSDRGPYRERAKFPRCPECRSRSTAQTEGGLICWACDHEWTPEGIYISEPAATH